MTDEFICAHESEPRTAYFCLTAPTRAPFFASVFCWARPLKRSQREIRDKHKVVVVEHIHPFVTGQRQTLTIGRSAHFSL